jgi:POT family proton-dependent oligopeptide transporter
MRSILILFLTATLANGGFGFDRSKGLAIYGVYTGMVYFVSLPGGWIADRVLGQRKAVLYGGILIAIGYLTLAVPSQPVFFTGLAIVIAGTGMLKPNISTIVGQIYSPDDPRRDSAFSIFYMGINIGSMTAPIICGWLGQRVSWHLGFAAAGVGMVLGVFTFLHGQKYLGEAGAHPADVTPEQMERNRHLLGRGLLAVASVAAVLLGLNATGMYDVTAERLANLAGIVLSVAVVGMFAWMFFGGNWTRTERKRLTVIAILFVASSLFWSAFEQAGGSMNLFADRNSDNVLFGFDFPASWYQSLNATFIVLCAPVFAWLWIRMGESQPSSPFKFALGLVAVGLGFVVLMIGAEKAGETGRVSPLWLVATYFFHTVGELLLSPVGLSAMTRLAPARVASLMMGVWFVSISAGNYFGGRLAAFYAGVPMDELFRTVALFAILSGVVLALIARPVARLSEQDRS